MTPKSVIFIEPVGSESNVFEKYMRLPLMGSLYLGTILHNEGYSVRIFNENLLDQPFDAHERQADAYCISALTVSARRARELALEIKRIHPESRVIIGGIHASLSPESFDGVADHIVYGEAETIIVDLVEGRFDSRLVRGAPMHDLDDLPLVNYRLLENYDSMDIIPVMTSRGCPFDCNFCTVTKIFGKKFRMQSPERIMREVRNALSVFKTRMVFFYDDNFTANRPRVKTLCELMTKEGLDFQWVTQVRSDIAKDPQLLDLMQQAGCRFFFIGFESINDATLKSMHKSQTRSDIERAIATIRKKGISIHGMFIFGDDNDTPESIRATVDFAIRHHIDTVQFMILTPFPGTQYYEEIAGQNRLLHQHWSYYNAMFTVFRPAAMTAATLQYETVKAYERFYSLRRQLMETMRLCVDITLDALTWNFSAAFKYSFDLVLLRSGARFLVGRYARTLKPYVAFLKRLESDAQGGAAASPPQTSVEQ
jgi:radical SAM superfamily enzyme YgiQ (UPF0313 family)